MERQFDLFKELTVETMELLVNVGLMNSVSEHWPEEVQENWCDRLESMAQYCRDQVREVQEFASAFDDD